MHPPPILSASHINTNTNMSIRLHTNCGCGKKGAYKNWPMVKPGKAAPVTGTALRTTGPVLADCRLERHRYTRDPINSGLTTWRLTVYVDAVVAESGRNPAIKHQIDD